MMTSKSPPILLFIIATILLALCLTPSLTTAQSLDGTYKPDGQCKSTATCCCSVGEFTVKSSADLTKVSVKGTVDGGKGCESFTSLSADFTAVDQYNAVWNVPIYNMIYQATASRDYSSVTVSRTDVSDTSCINKLSRVGGGVTPPASGTGTTTPTTTPPASTGSNIPGNVVIANPTTTTTTSVTSILTPPATFKATATPDIIMTTGQTEGVLTQDTHTVRYGVLQSSSSSDSYDIWFIMEPTSTLFSNLKGKEVAIHYIAGTTSVPTTAIDGSPINKALTAIDATAQARQWKLTGVRIPGGTGLRFAFSYVLATATTTYHTNTIYYQSTGSVSTSTNIVNSNGSGTTTVVTTTNTGSLWDGTFKVDSRCVKSDKCCCAQGNIVAKRLSNGKIQITSTLDGSSTCGNMKEVTGDFQLTSDRQATYRHPEHPIDLIAELSVDGNTISFKNSIYECLTYGIKQAGSGSSSSTTTNNNNYSTSGTTTTTSNYREQYLGTWTSSGTCKNTLQCCCLQKALQLIAPDEALRRGYEFDQAEYPVSDPNVVFGVGSLDGSSACFRKTSISGACKMDPATSTGTCNMNGVVFNAVLKQISGKTALVITNSMYTNCDSIAFKTSTGTGGGGRTSDATRPYINSKIFAVTISAVAIFLAAIALGA